MLPASKPFLSLTAADLLSPSLVMIPCEMSLRGAARLLSHAHVSGAPVVDQYGYCVGVLSAMDFMHFVEQGTAASKPSRRPPDVFSAGQIVEPDQLPPDQVTAYMTADPVLAGPATGIADLAARMVDAHIHRIVIVDGQSRPIGIVSSTDILAAVAQQRSGDSREAGSACPVVNEETVSCTQA
jgi:CBS domain-containing membrane protein